MSLKGKVYCGCCNHSMTLSVAENARFHCAHTRSAPGAACYQLSICASAISNLLYEIINKQVQVVFSVNHISDVRQIDMRSVRQTEYGKQIEMLNDESRQIYEQFVLGEVDAMGYKAARERIDTEVLRLEQACPVLSAELAAFEFERAQSCERKKIAECIREEKGLTRPLVDLLIKRVLIYPNNRVVIDWKVSSFFGTDVSAGQLDSVV